MSAMGESGHGHFRSLAPRRPFGSTILLDGLSWSGDNAIGSDLPAGGKMNATWTAFLAVFGIGSIVAALIARGVAIAQLRQAWINALRDDLAEVFATSDRIAKLVRDPPTTRAGAAKLTEQAHLSMAAHRRVLLRLNPSEALHLCLRGKLDDLVIVGAHDKYIAKIDDALSTAQALLKREWEVTKYGSFAGLVGWLKVLPKRVRRRFASTR